MAGFTLAVLRGPLKQLLSSVYLSISEHERFILGRNETLPVAGSPGAPLMLSGPFSA